MSEIVKVTSLDGYERWMLCDRTEAGTITLERVRWAEGPKADVAGERWGVAMVEQLRAGDVVSVDEDAVASVQDGKRADMNWPGVAGDSCLVLETRPYRDGVQVRALMYEDSVEYQEFRWYRDDIVLVWRKG